MKNLLITAGKYLNLIALTEEDKLKRDSKQANKAAELALRNEIFAVESEISKVETDLEEAMCAKPYSGRKEFLLTKKLEIAKVELQFLTDLLKERF